MGLQSRRCPLRRPARPRHREPVHRREPGLHHGLQLRSDDELRPVDRACRRSCAPLSRWQRPITTSRSRPMRHAPIAYMGMTGMSDGTCPWGNDTSGREGLRPSARQGQWLHDSRGTSRRRRLAARNTSATTSKGARRVIPSKCARSMAGTPRRASMTGPRPGMMA